MYSMPAACAHSNSWRVGVGGLGFTIIFLPQRCSVRRSKRKKSSLRQSTFHWVVRTLPPQTSQKISHGRSTFATVSTQHPQRNMSSQALKYCQPKVWTKNSRAVEDFSNSLRRLHDKVNRRRPTFRKELHCSSCISRQSSSSRFCTLSVLFRRCNSGIKLDKRCKRSCPDLEVDRFLKCFHHSMIMEDMYYNIVCINGRTSKFVGSKGNTELITRTIG